MDGSYTAEGERERPPPAPDEGSATVTTNRSSGESDSEVVQQQNQAISQPNISLHDDLLLELSAAFCNRDQCIKLAVKLRIGEADILKLFDAAYSDRTAYVIIKKWIAVHGDQATGQSLHAALHDVDRPDLAKTFETRLFDRGVVCAVTGGDDPAAVNVDIDVQGRKPCVSGGSFLNADLIREIGAAVSSHDQCVKLAVILKIGEDDLYKVVEATFTDTLAHEILKKWMGAHGKNATGSVLHAALIDAKRQDLADRFEERLLGQYAPHNGYAAGDVESSAVGLDPDSESLGMIITDDVLPPTDLLSEIASYLPKLKHCVQLAKNLCLPKNFVKQLEQGQRRGMTAIDVLYKWRQMKSKRATGKVLFDALIAMNKRDVAACFAEELLGTEMVDWEELCYDDEHRDFFQMLRRKRIDVFATFERMSCSRYFLNRLHHQAILTGPEYETLLHSSETLRECSAMNKKLMDVVNHKPPLVQEMFADKLCRYQAHLVMAMDGEKVSTLPSPDPSDQAEGTAAANATLELHAEGLMQDLKEQLVRFFNTLLLVRPVDFMPSDNIQLVSQMYVTLSTISYEEALKIIGRPQRLRDSQLLHAVSRIDAESKHSQELVDLHSLLYPKQGTPVKSALLFGSAGSGKSLTTLKILSEWNSESSTSAFKQFDAVVYLTGKERSRLGAANVQDLWRLQQMGFSEQEELFILNHFSQHSEKVLFLVDGWDEAGDHGILQDDSVLKKILDGDLFPQSAIIITTRPVPNAYPLLEKCKQRYSLVGFNNTHLQELFHRQMEEAQASKLFKTLSQSSHLHVKAAVQKTPLFAAMLVQLYQVDETLPSTVTALYQLMLESIRSRYVEWVMKPQESSNDMTMVDDKPAKADFDGAKRKLSGLALAGMMNNQVTFSSTDVMSCGRNVIKPRFGLLSEVKEVGNCGGDVLYHFCHMTWQEYLGAQCLAADPDFITKLRMCVHAMGVREHTHMFWRFLAGLVMPHLLADLVYELLQASGVSGHTPWETEFRLFLLECVAENLRMGQKLDEPSTANLYIHLAVELIAVQPGLISLEDCILDESCLSSIAVVLQACPNISSLHARRCRVDYNHPMLRHALCHLKSVEISSISGRNPSAFILTVIDSLRSSSTIGLVMCSYQQGTAGCMLTLAQLINDSLSLTELKLVQFDIGSAGMSCWSNINLRSLSLQCLYFEDDNFAGAGPSLGRICAGLPQLKTLQIVKCHLQDDDFAGLLTGLQGTNIEAVHVLHNHLTDDSIAPLMQFAEHRNHLSQQRQMPLKNCFLFVAGNRISDEVLQQLALMLPVNCNIVISSVRFAVAHSLVLPVTEEDFAKKLRQKFESSTDGHVSYSFPGFGDLGGILVAQLLKTDCSTRLKTLCLQYCDISDDGASAIAEALPRTRLEGLDLLSNQLTVTGFNQILCTLSRESSLQYLNVGVNPIFSRMTLAPSQLMVTIGNLSQSECKLKILCMSSTGLSDKLDSSESSPLALMAMPNLSVLDLSNNDITDRSVAMVMKNMANIEYLSLSGNRISSDGGKALMAKAEELMQNAEAEEQPSCRLQRLWLGGNGIDEVAFAGSNCQLISSEVLSVTHRPSFVLAMFSSVFSSSSNRHLPPLTLRHGARSPFLSRMNTVLQSKVLSSCLNLVIAENDMACFDRWLMRGLCAVAYHGDSENPLDKAKCLVNLLTLLGKWHLTREECESWLAVSCCLVCIIDELAVTCAMSELEPVAENTLSQVTQMCAVDGDCLSLTVQLMSDLAVRCHRRQLHAVAERLLQQTEYVSQQAWIMMRSLSW